MRSPVLFLVFNRPDTTARVLQAIREAAPPRLYIAADGPRPNRGGEAERCVEVRRIVSNIDWPCEVRTLFRDQNLGCKMAVSGAIDWFFEHEEEGIILEDDVLPDATFFPFCDELLERYRNDERIMAISGNNPLSGYTQFEADYFFSSLVHVWGWATWRRAWAQYDVSMKDWPSWQAKLSDFGQGLLFRKYWKMLFDATYAGQFNTWDYQWIFTIWKHNGLSATASKNLTGNLGFGEGATHTLKVPEFVEHSPVESIEFPLRHPSSVQRDLNLERLEQKVRFNLTYYRAFLFFIKKVFRFFAKMPR